MIDSSYIRRKLEALASDARNATGEAVVGVVLQFAAAGQGQGSSRQKIFVEKAIREGYRDGLQKMARFLIDAQANEEPTGWEHFKTVASGLVEELFWAHNRQLLAGLGPDTPLETRLRQQMTDDLNLTIEDAKHQIVGHTRHAPDPEELARMSIEITHSPGAVVQQGRDQLSQVVQQQHWDPTPLIEVVKYALTALDEIETRTPEREMLRTQLEALRDLSQGKEKNPSLIRRVGEIVGRLFKTSASAAAQSLGEKITGLLPL